MRGFPCCRMTMWGKGACRGRQQCASGGMREPCLHGTFAAAGFSDAGACSGAYCLDQGARERTMPVGERTGPLLWQAVAFSAVFLCK